MDGDVDQDTHAKIADDSSFASIVVDLVDSSSKVVPGSEEVTTLMEDKNLLAKLEAANRWGILYWVME